MTSPGGFDPYTPPEGQAPHAGFAPGPRGPAGRPGLTGLVARYRGDALAFALVLAACLVAAVIVGLVWEAVAPRVPLMATENGVYQLSPESETSIAQDGWFAVCGAVAGGILAPLAFWRFRRQGVAAALGLTAGGLAGAYLAYRIGAWLGPDDLRAQIERVGLGKRLEQPLDLQAQGVMYLWPIASLVIFLGLCAGFAPADDDGPAPRGTSGAHPADAAPSGPAGTATAPDPRAFDTAPDPETPRVAGDPQTPGGTGPDLVKRPPEDAD